MPSYVIERYGSTWALTPDGWVQARPPMTAEDMTTIADLTDAEKAQLRTLYAVHLNPLAAATYNHEVCRSLIGKHLAEERATEFPAIVSITARGIEIARLL